MPTGRSTPSCHGEKRRRRSSKQGKSHFRLRLAAFATVMLLVVGVTVYLLRPPNIQTVPADKTVQITMAGFDPTTLNVPTGQVTTVLLKNPDSSHHSDGGGVHEFAIPELGIDLKVQPESSAVATIPATAAPGTYTFYCDTCCGGKENPSMRGTLQVG